MCELLGQLPSIWLPSVPASPRLPWTSTTGMSAPSMPFQKTRPLTEDLRIFEVYKMPCSRQICSYSHLDLISVANNPFDRDVTVYKIQGFNFCGQQPI